MQDVLVRRFPSVFGNDVEMLCAVLVALNLHEHFSAFVKFLVLEDVSPHPGVALDGSLSRQIMSGHPGHDFLGRRLSLATVRRNDGRGRKQEQSSQQELIFHRQNSMTNLPRYSRQELLKNSPNLTLAKLFCTSRGSK